MGQNFVIHSVIACWLLMVLFIKLVPYTPQQNDTVVRKHRHILEVARALKFQSGVPIRFWGDCVKTAVYVINRLPTPVLEGRTPYELLYGKEPKVDYLRVFGYQCHATNLPRGDKIAPRARKVVFIGDVVFQEGRFPFKNIGVEADDMFHQLPISPEERIPASTPIQVVTQEDTGSSMNQDDIDFPENDHASADVEQEEVAPILAPLEYMDLMDTPDSALKEGSEEALPVEPVVKQAHAPITTNLPTQPVQREPRKTNPPIWMKDYVTTTSCLGTAGFQFPIVSGMTILPQHIKLIYKLSQFLWNLNPSKRQHRIHNG
ncbi:PREDICTED: uncharacterized protein LOC109235953 [Nicotiana attenuata]|uniref:uncharacterized protein LOC109235953 n=1 Tax=Nicotiana attenuata TaxID=49451 RepID=UPI000904606F|nr:PREDICTED: uncharacterized protein LOC109235953 [Nicotiana attenuata]